MKGISHKIIIAAMMLPGLFSETFAQQATTTASDSSLLSGISENTLLFWIAAALFLVVIILTSTVNSAFDLFKIKQLKEKAEKDSSGTTKVLGVLLLMLVSQIAFAQDAATNVATDEFLSASTYKYLLLTVIIIEVAVILFYIKVLRYLTGIEDAQKKLEAETGVKKATLWETLNQFQPIEKENDLDVGHSYDGIRELDNITPPWFVAGFVASIIFAGIYLYRYHIAEAAPLQIEEYQAELKQAELEKAERLKNQPDLVDENNVAMLGADGIANGKKLFTNNCASCHGDKGQGGVGPNLTDAYWLHGGAVNDVFKLIKYGFESKGMRAWKDDFSGTQIAELASYIKSLEGSNPPGAKEKQGDLYVPVAETKVAADSTQAK